MKRESIKSKKRMKGRKSKCDRDLLTRGKYNKNLVNEIWREKCVEFMDVRDSFRA